MIEKDFNLKTKQGLTLFAHTWEPSEKPKAVLVLVHGIGEHCLRYTPYFKLFVEAGISIFGFDLIGHGQSEGKKGAIKSYDALMDDIEISLLKVKQIFPNLPQFIYGHSMGGNLALNYLLRRPSGLKGGIITSPWLALTEEPNVVLKGLVSILKNIIPNMTIDSGLDSKNISSISAEIEKYDSDPLNHGRISFRLFNELSKSGKWALENIQQLALPTLLLHGTDDKITSPIASKVAASNNSQFILHKEWPNVGHELHNDTCRNEVAKKSITWILNQI
ncbi:MAG: lysophospholipase [Salinivirgaceae bacterium]|jgi:alpha-beta hydrolase superfamily lysophospholipase|nr:lysophospholipase [Salinivirgaceae bacterium]